MFGHEKGAFTGALSSRLGRLAEAEGGTLFLDEIGDFSPAVQLKLLRVIQEREYQPVGSNKTFLADVRILAATHVNLEEQLKAGRFRQDLYYRINVFPVFLPPLRERVSDIPELANYFLETLGQRLGKKVRRISTKAVNALMGYTWPGNIRELANCIEHALLSATGDVVFAEHLPPTVQTPDLLSRESVGSLKMQVQLLEKELMNRSLRKNHGNLAAAARDLGITPRIFRYKWKQMGLTVPE